MVIRVEVLVSPGSEQDGSLQKRMALCLILVIITTYLPACGIFFCFFILPQANYPFGIESLLNRRSVGFSSFSGMHHQEGRVGVEEHFAGDAGVEHAGQDVAAIGAQGNEIDVFVADEFFYGQQ